MRAAAAALLFALTLAAPAAGQTLTLAPTASSDLRQICQTDRGRLWGVDLCGPLLVVDPSTRLAWADLPDNTHVLEQSGDGWFGTLPAGVPVANTSVEWAGQRWIMVLAPLPENAVERRVLVAHEAWHRAQAQLGLAAQASDCAHLETERGRLLLRLEMRALATALRSRGAARRRAAQDAVMLRAARLSELREAAAAGEAALDRNEGLASYTGVKLGAGADAEMFAAHTLDDYDRHDAYARAYAYATGPAYGLLLDQFQPNWRTVLGAYTPADLLVSASRATLGDARRLRRAMDRYGGVQIGAEERARAEAQVARIAALRARFAEGPRLVLPLSAMQMEFNPNQITPVEGLGSVYGTLTIRDVWGELRATDGALISEDFTQLVAPAPDGAGVAGPGWSLILAPTYRPTPPDPSGRRSIELIPPPPQ